jgi:signal transduction histidine kinase
MNVAFSIRSKFLVVISCLLAVCVSIYLLIAVKVFKSDKIELVYDLNRSQVSNLASELDTHFASVSDKFKLFAILSGRAQGRWMADLFTDESDVVFVSLFKKNGSEVLRQYQNKKFREVYSLSEKFFDKELPGHRTIPFQTILKSGEAIWNATGPSGPPLIGFGRSVVVEDSQGVAVDQMAVVGYIKADRILKSLSLVKLSEITVANIEGEVLAHLDVKRLGSKSLTVTSPLFQSAQTSKARTSVINFEHRGEKILGAFSKSHGGKVVILAEASEDSAFSVVSDLIERSLIFSLIIFTAAFLAAVLLSRSLTRPLAQLVERMSLVSQGDLTSRISLHTRDEIAVLAESFNRMIVDLKQSRDELEEINRDLDLKVKDRTRELEIQNHKVKEAQEALIRTTRLASAGEIAGRAAHEVLNPLTSLLTRVGLMERKIRSEMSPQLQVLKDISGAWTADFDKGGFDLLVNNWKQPSQLKPEVTLWREDLENLHGLEEGLDNQIKSFHSDIQFLMQEGARINKIINGMRKLSNIRSDKQNQSAHEILKDCCHIMGDLFAQRGYLIRHEFHAEHDTVQVDRDELVQSVTNMMRNSLQSLHEAETQTGRKGFLCLATNLVENQLQIYFEDSGVGIPPENQSRLFESQFTTKSPEEGTGLGLGISRRFVRGWGGDIEFVSSQPHQKTVFRMIIPISESKNTGAAA